MVRTLQDILDDAKGLAANLVEDFSETKSDAPEMPRTMQVGLVAASIAELIEAAYEMGREHAVNR